MDKLCEDQFLFDSWDNGFRCLKKHKYVIPVFQISTAGNKVSNNWFVVAQCLTQEFEVGRGSIQNYIYIFFFCWFLMFFLDESAENIVAIFFLFSGWTKYLDTKCFVSFFEIFTFLCYILKQNLTRELIFFKDRKEIFGTPSYFNSFFYFFYLKIFSKFKSNSPIGNIHWKKNLPALTRIHTYYWVVVLLCFREIICGSCKDQPLVYCLLACAVCVRVMCVWNRHQYCTCSFSYLIYSRSWAEAQLSISTL